MSDFDTVFPGLSTALAILAIVVAIAWILMPFALFGTKPILRDLLAEAREQTRLSRELLDAQRGLSQVERASLRQAEGAARRLSDPVDRR